MKGMRRLIGIILPAADLLLLAATAPAQPQQAKTAWLDEMDVRLSSCGWRTTQKNKSVGGNPLRLGGKTYARGIGTHSPGEFRLRLDGAPARFRALVGIDDESGPRGTVEFRVQADKKVLWTSGVMKGGQPPKPVDVDLTGVKLLRLIVTVGGDNYGHDHTDWVEARIEFSGKPPQAVRAPTGGPVLVEFPDVQGAAAVVPAKPDELRKDWETQYSETARAKGKRYLFPASQALNPQALALPTDRGPLDIAARRLEALLAKLARMPEPPAVSSVQERLAEIRTRADLPGAEALPLYLELRQATREAVLANPLLDFDSIPFISRGVLNDHKTRKSEYDGDHFCDQYYGHNGRTGGGLFILRNWRSADAQVIDVVAGLRAPSGRNGGMLLSDGTFLSPDLSWNGRTIAFAWSSGDPEKWNPDGRFSIFTVNMDGSCLTRLTDGASDDFDPCWLPNGRLVFLSTRRRGFGRCHGRPVPVFTMYSMDADGTDLIPIDFHETNEFHPSVDNHGKLVYTRWDYVDRDHSAAHHMWHSFPDGRDPRSFHANYPVPLTTVEGGQFERGINMRPWAEFNCRSIPGSHKFVATAGPHHGQAFGSPVVIDLRIPDDNRMSQVKRLTPDALFPESECGMRSWAQMAFGTAWPLSESFYLCNYKDSICVIDEFGNRDLVCKVINGLRPIDPIPLRARQKPPILTTQTHQGKRRSADSPPATVSIIDVYSTDEFGRIPDGLKIRELRVVQLIPKSTPNANSPRIGRGSQSLARIPLGVVPVEEDGSAYFTAPVGKAIYFQALDESGMAVTSMRSATYVHPGEHLTCLGCHEDKHQAPPPGNAPLALQRRPSELRPEIPNHTMFSFHRHVRPIFERSCVSCHRQTENAGPRDMSYNKLDAAMFYLGHGYGTPLHGGTRSTPGRFGARFSKMGKALLGENHRRYLQQGKFSHQDVRAIVMWLDMNSNELSAYKEPATQKRGDIVWPEFDVDPENYTGVQSACRQ